MWRLRASAVRAECRQHMYKNVHLMPANGARSPVTAAAYRLLFAHATAEAPESMQLAVLPPNTEQPGRTRQLAGARTWTESCTSVGTRSMLVERRMTKRGSTLSVTHVRMTHTPRHCTPRSLPLPP